MIGLALAMVVGTAVTWVLLLHADRWAWHEPRPLPPELQERLARGAKLVATFGWSAKQASRAAAHMADVFALAGDTWALALHWPHELDPGVPTCHFDGKPWPCPEHERLTASVATRRARLDQPTETVGGNP